MSRPFVAILAASLRNLAVPAPAAFTRGAPSAPCRRALAFLAVFLAVSGPGQAAAPALPAAAYAQAERVHDFNLKGQVRNARVVPHWLGDGRFWYRRDDDSVAPYRLVDPAARRQAPLFDGVRVRQAWPEAAGIAPAVPELLSVRSPSATEMLAIFRGGDSGDIECALARYACRTVPAMPRDAQRLPAPDGRRSLFVRDDNLWLHDPHAGDRALTHDGVPLHGYGVLPDFTLRAIPHRQGRLKVPPFATHWSPDGRWVFGTRYDERKVGRYPLVASAPQDGFRPFVHEIRMSLLGDPEPVRDAWFVVDTAGSGVRAIAIPEGWNGLAEAGVLGWSGSRVYAAIARYDRPARLRLVEIDLASGAVRTIVEERSDTRVQLNDYFYNRAAVRILAGREEAIWFSERDGWGHLYLYDRRDGRLIRRLTSGDWLVRDIVGVDEARRRVYFTAGGREGGDPYQRRLYRVPLDGGQPVLLTAEAADHAIDDGPGALVGALAGGGPSGALSPAGDIVVDSYSTVDQPPVTVLRSTEDGAVVLELERADASAVYAAGWRPPVRTRVKAADGRTDLYATVYFPPDYSPERSHPVIDAIYGGPHVTNAPVGFVEATTTMNPVSRASLAALGFVVVTIDARGTPGRSQAFHDASFGPGGGPQIDDHVAAIQALARRYRGMDLARVGIYGHSFGGYTSTRALLLRPDFYKAAVSSAGSHNGQGMYSGPVNGVDRLVAGPPVYGTAGAARPSPGTVADNYRQLDNAVLADRLAGKLLLVYGELDEHAPAGVTVQLVDALVKAGKTFDLVVLPNQDHDLFRNDPYYTRRLWDHFVEHLMGRTPPDYRITSLPGRR